jgi:hypothetical protein
MVKKLPAAYGDVTKQKAEPKVARQCDGMILKL